MNLDDILKERKEAYGEPKAMHKLIGQYWSAYLGKQITASDVAAMMVLFKIARASHGDNEKTADDLLDAVGYMTFAERFRRDEAKVKARADKAASHYNVEYEKVFDDGRVSFSWEIPFQPVSEDSLKLYYAAPEEVKPEGLTREEETVLRHKTGKVKDGNLTVGPTHEEEVERYLDEGYPLNKIIRTDRQFEVKMRTVGPTAEEFDKLCGKKPVDDYQAFIDDLFERNT